MVYNEMPHLGAWFSRPHTCDNAEVLRNVPFGLLRCSSTTWRMRVVFLNDRAKEWRNIIPARTRLPKIHSASQWIGTFATRTCCGRAYRLYVPTQYKRQNPTMLIIMLHGCTQTPDDFALGTQMNDYAEQQTFLVAYPEQPRSASPLRCWNWDNPRHQSRG
jgi:hypothetical protein